MEELAFFCQTVGILIWNACTGWLSSPKPIGSHVTFSDLPPITKKAMKQVEGNIPHPPKKRDLLPCDLVADSDALYKKTP